jgi:hypothetical protein
MKKVPKIVPILVIGVVVLLVLAKMNKDKVEEKSSACGCGS